MVGCAPGNVGCWALAYPVDCDMCFVWLSRGAYRALCARCVKSWLFSTTGSSVSLED